MTTPTTRKLGRLPNSGRPRVRLTADHVPASYSPPATLDRYTAIPVATIGMDGNDSVADCTCADVDHELKCVQVAAGNPEVTSTAAEVLAAYSAITGYDPADPNSDQGAEMQQVRDFWQKTGFTLGGTVHKILLFAELDVHDVTVGQWVLDQFGAVGVGVNLPQSAMDQFDAGQPWDVVADDGGILGGHAVAYVGYTAAGPVFLSWGQVVHATWAWWSAYVEEAWGSFLRDIVDAQGNSPTHETLYQLGQEFSAQFGKPNPVPAPIPSPTPPPGPSPTPVPPAPTPVPVDEADIAFAQVLIPWQVKHHVGDNHEVQIAAQHWLGDKGFLPNPEER